MCFAYYYKWNLKSMRWVPSPYWQLLNFEVGLRDLRKKQQKAQLCCHKNTRFWKELQRLHKKLKHKNSLHLTTRKFCDSVFRYVSCMQEDIFELWNLAVQYVKQHTLHFQVTKTVWEKNSSPRNMEVRNTWPLDLWPKSKTTVYHWPFSLSTYHYSQSFKWIKVFN